MGVKRIHLQLAAKRRWQTLLDSSIERDAGLNWQSSTRQQRWPTQQVQVSSKAKVLP